MKKMDDLEFVGWLIVGTTVGIAVLITLYFIIYGITQGG